MGFKSPTTSIIEMLSHYHQHGPISAKRDEWRNGFCASFANNATRFCYISDFLQPLEQDKDSNAFLWTSTLSEALHCQFCAFEHELETTRIIHHLKFDPKINKQEIKAKTQKKCPVCHQKNPLVVKIVAAPILIVCPMVGHLKNKTRDEISESLMYGSQDYKLVAAIWGNGQHFVANLYHENCWWFYDDLQVLAGAVHAQKCAGPIPEGGSADKFLTCSCLVYTQI